MADALQFFLPMIPPTVTAQEHRIAVIRNKPCVFDPPELRAAREKLAAHLSRHRPERPLSGAPLRLTVKWCFPSGPGRPNGSYRITPPDTDNLNKLLKDVMTRCGFWKDDALVASEITEKFWADRPGIFIRVEEVGP